MKKTKKESKRQVTCFMAKMASNDSRNNLFLKNLFCIILFSLGEKDSILKADFQSRQALFGRLTQDDISKPFPLTLCHTKQSLSKI